MAFGSLAYIPFGELQRKCFLEREMDLAEAVGSRHGRIVEFALVGDSRQRHREFVHLHFVQLNLFFLLRL